MMRIFLKYFLICYFLKFKIKQIEIEKKELFEVQKTKLKDLILKLKEIESNSTKDILNLEYDIISLNKVIFKSYTYLWKV